MEFNDDMGLPTYHQIHLRTGQLEEVKSFLSRDMNLRHPVAVNLKALEIDQQREIIGVIENYFVSNNISFKFPYPIYIVTDLDPAISNMPVAKLTEELPKFFSQKDSKMNVKEMHLASKNKLIQQEVKNCDANMSETGLKSYGTFHRRIHDLEKERKFYIYLLNRLSKARNG